MAIKIQNIKGKRIRPKHQYKLRLDFMIGDADHFYSNEFTFNPDDKIDSYVFEKHIRLFKRAVGHYTSRAQVSKDEIAKEIIDSLSKDEKFTGWLIGQWGLPEDTLPDFDSYLSEYLEWGSCEYNGDYHRLTNIDYWYIDKDGDKCKVSLTGSMKL